MSIPMNVTIDNWVFEAIEVKKRRENKSRSEAANELLSKAIMTFEPIHTLDQLKKSK